MRASGGRVNEPEREDHHDRDSEDKREPGRRRVGMSITLPGLSLHVGTNPHSVLGHRGWKGAILVPFMTAIVLGIKQFRRNTAKSLPEEHWELSRVLPSITDIFHTREIFLTLDNATPARTFGQPRIK